MASRTWRLVGILEKQLQLRSIGGADPQASMDFHQRQQGLVEQPEDPRGKALAGLGEGLGADLVQQVAWIRAACRTTGRASVARWRVMPDSRRVSSLGKGSLR